MTTPKLDFGQALVQQPPPKKKIDFSQAVVKPRIDFSQAELKPIVTNEDPNDTGLLETTGNFFSYIKNATLSKNFATQIGSALSSILGGPPTTANYQYDKDTGNMLVKNALNFIGKLPTNTSPIGIATSPIVMDAMRQMEGQSIGGIVASGLNPANLITGIEGLLTTPLEVLTQTTNVNGEAVPSTPAQQALAVQKAIAIAAQMKIAGTIISRFAPQVAGEAALAPSKAGVISQSIGAHVAGNVAGGAALGAISELGQEDQLSSSIANALAFAPLGVLTGTFGGVKLIKNVGKERAKFLNETATQNAQDLAAAKGLQITPNSSVYDVLSDIDAIASSDGLVEAVVKAKLNIGEGAIAYKLKPETIKSITEELSPSKRITEGLYEPSPEIASLMNRFKPNLGGLIKHLGLEFGSLFDKAVYYSKTKAELIKKNIPVPTEAAGYKILEDLKSKTGLTESEILSHRLEVKRTVKALAKGTKDKSIFLPKQNFNPQAGRTPYEFNVYTHEPTSTTLITPWKLNEPTLEFFNKSGFLPNQVVTYGDGLEYVVRGFKEGKLSIQKVNGKRIINVEPHLVTTVSESLTSELWKDANGNQIGRLGVVNIDNYFDALYEKFKSKFVLDQPPQTSFKNEILKFGQEIGMDNKGDLANLQKAFYLRLKDDVIAKFENPEPVKALEEKLLEYGANFRKELGTQLSLAANGNGMYIVPEGAGRYNIKSISTGETLETVTSAEQALEFINKSGRTNALNLDGGDTGGIPPTIANLGGMADPYNVYDTNAAQWWDYKINSGRFARYIAPSESEFRAIDRRGTQFSKHFYAMQIANGILKTKLFKEYKPLEESYNELVKLARKHGIKDPVRMGYISDWLETKNIPEIAEKVLPDRVMNATEMTHATKLSKVDVDNVVNYMYEVNKESSSPNGSAGFKAKQAEIGSRLIRSDIPKYSPEVVKAGNELFDLALQPQDVTNPFAIVRLAQALRNPEHALTRTEFEAKYEFTPAEKSLAQAIEQWNKVADAKFSIDPNIRFDMFINHAKVATAVGFNPFSKLKTKSEFVSTLANLGVKQNGVLERNPILLARNKLYAGTRTAKIAPASAVYPELAKTQAGTELVSFNDIIKNAENYMMEIGDPKNPKFIQDMNPFLSEFSEHIADVKGIPDNSDLMGKAAVKSLEETFGKGFHGYTKAAILLTHAAYLGGRLALTVRDVLNATQIAYYNYGPKFAIEMLTRSIKREQAKALMDTGIIPLQQGIDLLMPGENIHAGLERLGKVANTVTKYNGNQLAHMQMSAAIYLTTVDRVAELSGQMLKNEITKQKAYSKLHIQKLDPSTQTRFDNLISAGKTAEAAELLGRYRVKETVNIYGLNNNPISWNTTWGRVAGGMMSWGVNQVQTLANLSTRGTKLQRAHAIMRWGISNAAIYAGGTYLGFNMMNWMINPFNLIGTSPLLNAGTETMKSLNNLANPNPQARDRAIDEIINWVPHNDKTLAHIYLPYSRMVQDIVDGVNMLNQDYGPVGFGKMIGMPVNKATRSPFQQDIGTYPWNEDKAGNIRRLPNP